MKLPWDTREPEHYAPPPPVQAVARPVQPYVPPPEPAPQRVYVQTEVGDPPWEALGIGVLFSLLTAFASMVAFGVYQEPDVITGLLLIPSILIACYIHPVSVLRKNRHFPDRILMWLVVIVPPFFLSLGIYRLMGIHQIHTDEKLGIYLAIHYVSLCLWGVFWSFGNSVIGALRE